MFKTLIFAFITFLLAASAHASRPELQNRQLDDITSAAGSVFSQATSGAASVLSQATSGAASAFNGVTSAGASAGTALSSKATSATSASTTAIPSSSSNSAASLSSPAFAPVVATLFALAGGAVTGALILA